MNHTLRIGIIDYGVGNTFSVKNALEFLGYRKIFITAEEKTIESMDALIFPGVGAFDEAYKQLDSKNLNKILTDIVLGKKTPILGICLGMQLFASSSEENGYHEGLGWIPGKVVKINTPSHLPVPHVGWNDILINTSEPIYTNNSERLNFYFDHSYHFQCDAQYVSAVCDYGISITASVQRDNIFGVQFHPEKSQISGLRLFRSFLNSV